MCLKFMVFVKQKYYYLSTYGFLNKLYASGLLLFYYIFRKLD